MGFEMLFPWMKIRRQAGGPSYNMTAEVFALVDRVNSGMHRSFTTPLMQSVVDDLVERSRKPMPVEPKSQ